MMISSTPSDDRGRWRTGRELYRIVVSGPSSPRLFPAAGLSAGFSRAALRRPGGFGIVRAGRSVFVVTRIVKTGRTVLLSETF